MAVSKFKTGDRVKIVENWAQPQFFGKVGKIKKAFPTWDKEVFVYRVEVNGETLKGVALDENLEKA